MKHDEIIIEKRPELVNRQGIMIHHRKIRPHTFLVARR